MVRKTTESQDRTDVFSLTSVLRLSIREEASYSSMFKGPDDFNGTLRASRELLQALNKLANHQGEVSELELKEAYIRLLDNASNEYVENSQGQQAEEYRRRHDYIEDIVTNIWVYRVRA